MIALGAALAAVVILMLCLVRLLSGPTLYDRVVAANACVLLAAVVAAAFSVWLKNAAGADAAIVLIMASLAGNVAVFKFFYARTFQSALASTEEAQ